MPLLGRVTSKYKEGKNELHSVWDRSLDGSGWPCELGLLRERKDIMEPHGEVRPFSDGDYFDGDWSIMIALIPARGGSKRIKSKNLRLLAGKPLILHTIECAKKSKYDLRIVVSTDDDSIAQLSLKNEVEVVRRPWELSQGTALPTTVIRHALNSLDIDTDIIVLLQCTSPLRLPEDIDNAIGLLGPAIDSVSSTCNGTENGAVYAIKKHMLDRGTLYGITLMYEMPKERSIDINDEADWMEATLLMEERE